MWQGLMAVVVMVGLNGCATTMAFNPVPAKAVARAQLAGFTNIRVWGDAKPAEAAALLEARAPSFVTAATGMPFKSHSNEYAYLALSGGGSNGAYGAGLLVGWTASRQRPAFKVVTGVSTGALAAPFAFLGSSYDGKLREIYTQYSTNDLGSQHLFAALLGGPSLIDSQGLETLLERYVDGHVLSAIAREHERGRRLLVTTTNVEAERQVIWNLGAIAASRHPSALSLFRRILLASAAVPGVFPPVLIKVVADGQEFEEMHADGGMVGQVFFVPPKQLALSAMSSAGGAVPTLYVIRNGKLGPEYQSVTPTGLEIAGRSLGTLIKNQARGDLERLSGIAAQAGMSFKLAAIPATFTAISEEPFDRAYMRKLFDLGNQQARTGYIWAKAPP